MVAVGLDVLGLRPGDVVDVNLGEAHVDVVLDLRDVVVEQPVVHVASSALRGHQSRVTEQPQLVGDRGGLHAHGPGELGDRGGSLPEAPEDVLDSWARQA